MGGQLLARPGETGIGHVAEGERFTGVFGKTAQALAHGGGGGQVGIAQAEVIDVRAFNWPPASNMRRIQEAFSR